MKFSIRDMLWLTILVAVGVAWWLDHRSTARRLEELHMQVQVERVQREMERAQAQLLEALARTQQAKADEALARMQLLESAKGLYEEQAKQSP